MAWNLPEENREEMERSQEEILASMEQSTQERQGRPQAQTQGSSPEGGEGEGEGEGEQPTSPGEYIPRLEFEALQQEKTQLQQRMQVLAQNMMSPEYIEFLQSRREGGQPSQSGPTQGKGNAQSQEGESEIDLETASQKEIAEYIMTQVNTLVEERVGEVNKKVSSQEYKAQLQGVQEDVARLEKQYPDFWNHQQDMVEIAKRYPSISAKEAYLLAKGQKGDSQPKPKPQAKITEGGEGTSAQPKPRPIVGGARPKGISSQSAQADRPHTYESAIEQVMKELNI